MREVDDKAVVNILSTLVVCLLIDLQRLMPEYSKKRRCINKVEVAIKELSKLHSAPLDDELVGIGNRIWSVVLVELRDGLSEAHGLDEQLRLF